MADYNFKEIEKKWQDKWHTGCISARLRPHSMKRQTMIWINLGRILMIGVWGFLITNLIAPFPRPLNIFMALGPGAFSGQSPQLLQHPLGPVRIVLQPVARLLQPRRVDIAAPGHVLAQRRREEEGLLLHEGHRLV